MAAPADYESRLVVRAQDPCIPQYVKHGIRNAGRAREIETRAVQDVVVRVQQVPQHGEQMLANAADHLRPDECVIGRIAQLERDTSFVLDDCDPEVLVSAQDLSDVVLGGAGVEHRQ